MLSRVTTRSWTMAQRHANSIGSTVKKLAALMKDIRKLLIFLATCSKDMLEAIGRNTVLLLQVANQMKQVIQAMEAIPRQLDVDIVRLDDALGDSWGLPLQACTSWDSFSHILQNVVSAGRPGLSRVNTFVITLATSGGMMHEWNWEAFIKKGVHLQQAMVVFRGNTASSANGCPFPGCSGVIQRGHDSRDATCGRQASSKKIDRSFTSLIMMGWEQWPRKLDSISINDTVRDPLGLSPLQKPLDNELQQFRRIYIFEPDEPVRDMDETLFKLSVRRHRCKCKRLR
ncbi:hypothetical protein B0T18DRAFT_322194 [Schizothecium vesticola]|uniref:Ubiquitin-like domain-containing protein n=1 Tax=Schizothecium vesticola TaxID=314040 RepID=A0AA40K8K5_9PEZI|nr:hypothetical protein B0T18DRAFT_322194 [Schizothecium vesticola]